MTATGVDIHPLALEFLTYADVPFGDGIRIASENGYRRTTLMATPFGPLTYLDLLHDRDLKRRVAQECERYEMSIDALDVFVAVPDADLEEFSKMCRTAEELGAPYIIMLAVDPDHDQLADLCRRMVDIAERWQRKILVEVHRNTALPTLAEAAQFFEEFEVDKIAVELDSLHFFRAGSTISELQKYGHHVARAQVADGLAVGMNDADYRNEAMSHRLVPGTGEFPLRDFIRNLPAGITVGIEVPNSELSAAERAHRSRTALTEWAAESGADPGR